MNVKNEKSFEKPFMKIHEACNATGLSQFFLRRGCKDGSIPCVKSGTVYYIDMEKLMEKLREQRD